MSRTICILFLFLAACTSAAPLSTSMPSATFPPPTITATSTSTPDPMLSVIDALWEKGIKASRDIDSGNGWGLIINGEPVSGAFFDEDGKFLHVGNEQIPVEDAADRLELRADGLLFLKNEAGVNIAFFDSQNPENNFVFFDTPDALAKLTAEQKLAISPDTLTQTLENETGESSEVVLQKSNVSTVKPELVIYRDQAGNAQKVLDIETGDVMDLREAGIVELDMTDGSKMEVRAFSDAKEAIDFVAENAMRFEGSKTKVLENYPQLKEAFLNLKEKCSAIVGISPKDGGLAPSYPGSEEFFTIGFRGFESDAEILNFIDKESAGVVLLLDNPDSADRYEDIRQVLEENYNIY